jgi:hypothetical protein
MAYGAVGEKWKNLLTMWYFVVKSGKIYLYLIEIETSSDAAFYWHIRM